MVKFLNNSNGAVEKTFEKRALNYDDESPWMRHKLSLDSFVCEPFGAGQALDLCAGTGLVTKSLLDSGWNVVALDLTIEMLELSNAPVCVVADAALTPFTSGCFDLVVCRQGLHYLDLHSIAAELSRLSPLEIRLGQIVAPLPEVAKWWNELFVTLSPGRLKVFLPGDLERFICLLDGDWNVETSRFSLTDAFSRNFQHLSGKSYRDVVEILSSMPPNVARAMDYVEDEYRQDWEIVVARRKASS